MSEETAPIARVRHLTLTDFRGFKGTHHLDTDADLVLITGSNGTGKTSLLDALTLLLTGWYHHDAANLSSQGSGGFGLEAKVTGGTGRLRLCHTGGEKPGLPEGLPSSPLSPVDAEKNDAKTSDYELPARLCAFFQDRLDSLFDKAARGRTLRDVFESLPPDVEPIQDALTDAITGLEGEAKPWLGDTWTRKPPEELQAALQVAATAVAALLNEMDGHREDNQTSVALALDGVADLAAFDRAAEDWLNNRGRRLGRQTLPVLRDTFGDEVRRTLEAWIARAQAQAREMGAKTAQLQAKREAVQVKLDDIKAAFPHLDQDLAHYAARDDLPDALALFQALASHAGAWAKPPPGDHAGALTRIGEEFARVSTTDASICVEILGAWLAPRQEADKKRAGLMVEQSRLEQELKNSKTSDRLNNLQGIQPHMTPALKALADAWAASHQHRSWQDNADNRERARKDVEKEITKAKAVEEKLQFLTAPSKELMEDLQTRANTVLGRFALVEGVLPLKLEAEEKSDTTPRRYHVVTEDGRRLEHLSTGQRGQIAVSLLVAQNLAVSTMLAHRVILLDDVTTAYDLSNLTREAILWRQLAYGTDDDRMRRQVFISSHHEDMSNHLLDLLVPPPDEEQGKERRTMRLIRFTGWSNQTGPTYESYTVEPSRAVDRNDLAEALGKL